MSNPDLGGQIALLSSPTERLITVHTNRQPTMPDIGSGDVLTVRLLDPTTCTLEAQHSDGVSYPVDQSRGWGEQECAFLSETFRCIWGHRQIGDFPFQMSVSTEGQYSLSLPLGVSEERSETMLSAMAGAFENAFGYSLSRFSYDLGKMVMGRDVKLSTWDGRTFTMHRSRSSSCVIQRRTGVAQQLRYREKWGQEVTTGYVNEKSGWSQRTIDLIDAVFELTYKHLGETAKKNITLMCVRDNKPGSKSDKLQLLISNDLRDNGKLAQLVAIVAEAFATT